jgi:hypothetical protein
MKKLLALVFVGLLTLSFGVAVASCHFVSSRVRPAVQLVGPPCRVGLVSIDPQPEVPIRITVSDAVCNSSYEAKVQFVAENIGTVPISKFEIGGIDTYDRPVEGRKGVNTIGSNLYPRQTNTGWIGSSAIPKSGGAPDLTSYKLSIRSVTYADGRTWTRAALK